MAQTLAELKAANAALEEEVVETPQVDTTETDEAAAEEVIEETTDDLGEGTAEVVEETEVEAWMQTEEQASESADKKFTDSDIAAAKHKLRAKLDRKHNDEMEALKAKIAQLERGTVQNPQGNMPQGVAPQGVQMPTLEQFDYDDARYQQALSEWQTRQMMGRMAHMQQAQQRRQLEEAQKAQLNQSVDQHYERAAILSQETGIDPAAYQSADMQVRQAIESVMPNQGDLITDQLISNLGEGSEKVFYYLGVNAQARDKLRDALAADKSGIRAALYLGQLAAEKLSPQKRVSRAPKPAPQVQGDAGTLGTDKWLKQYKKASSPQERLNIKKQAKAEGIDTSNFINSI